MPQEKADLNTWLTRVQGAKKSDEVLRILDDFRPLNWTDEERAAMSKVYVRIMQRLGPPAASQAAQETGKSDGPVWYEKM